MFFIDRPPIHPYFPAVSEVFLLGLAAAVVGRAQGLQFSEPEAPLVTMMRDQMVRYGRRDHKPLAQTHRTKRMRAQLRLGAFLPATKSVPAIISGFLAQPALPLIYIKNTIAKIAMQATMTAAIVSQLRSRKSINTTVPCST